MELLSVIRARSVCLFDLNELNPRGKAVYPELIQRLKDKYAFAKVPASQFDYEKDSNALAWIDGRFRVAEGFVSVDLRIYFDGVVVDTRSSTNDADLFLHEVFELVNSEFGLSYRPEMISKRFYFSELSVRADCDLINLNQKLKAFADRLTSRVGKVAPFPFEPSSLVFSCDPSIPSPLVAFRFEHKVNVPFAERKYYSTAPLGTDDHLALLGELEQILKS